MDVREANNGVESELLKYMLKIGRFAKDGTLELLPEDQLLEAAIFIKKVRGVTTGGSWYGIMKDENPEREPGEDHCIEYWTSKELMIRCSQGDLIAKEVFKGILRWCCGHSERVLERNL